MADMDPEEFRKFILDNREIIQSILDEGKEPTEEKTPEEKLDEALTETKEKIKGLNYAALSIFSDDDVQKHFITGCLEFIHFFEAIIDAAPLSPEVREMVKKAEQARDRTIRNVVVVGAKDKMENITINDVKKAATGKTSTLEKIENISIRDIKDSIREHKQ